MNGWNLYFLAYFIQNIQKLNLRGPRTSNISLKFIESPFNIETIGYLICFTASPSLLTFRNVTINLALDTALIERHDILK